MSAKGAKGIIASIPAREWRGLVPEWAGGRLNVAFRCHLCGCEDHWSAAQMIGPERVVPKVIQLGWEVGGKLTCPACIVARREGSRVAALEKLRPDHQKQERPMATVTKIPTAALVEDQKKNKRLAILALEDDYDETARAYRAGKSDKTVAEELGLSADFIRAVREEFYGAMVEPGEVSAMRREIGAARALIDGLEAKLTGLCSRQGWKV